MPTSLEQLQGMFNKPRQAAGAIERGRIKPPHIAYAELSTMQRILPQPNTKTTRKRQLNGKGEQQVKIFVDADTAHWIGVCAKTANMTRSRYLSELVENTVNMLKQLQL